MEQSKALGRFACGVSMRSAQRSPQDRVERVRRLRARATQARANAAAVGDKISRASLLNVAIRYDNAAEFLSRFSSERDTDRRRIRANVYRRR
jgi:hypothetical protein